jgi:hypothetical protein
MLLYFSKAVSSDRLSITHVAWFALSITRGIGRLEDWQIYYYKLDLQHFHGQNCLLDTKLTKQARCNLLLFSGNIEIKYLIIY